MKDGWETEVRILAQMAVNAHLSNRLAVGLKSGTSKVVALSSKDDGNYVVSRITLGSSAPSQDTVYSTSSAAGGAFLLACRQANGSLYDVIFWDKGGPDGNGLTWRHLTATMDFLRWTTKKDAGVFTKILNPKLEELS